ncbi:MAG: hypothetical protein WB592_08265, partial [Acidimicrobiales bacterium]
MVVSPATIARAASPPAYTNSEYPTTLNTTDNFNDGYSYGTINVSGVHILAFQHPAFDSSTSQLGTKGYGDVGFWSNQSIITAAEQWALGWFESSSTATLTLAIGTSDAYDLGRPPGCTQYCLPATMNYPDGSNTGPYVAGWYWATWTNRLQNWLDDNSYGGQTLSGRVTAGSGIDAEAGTDWDTDFGDNTEAWSNGYNSNTSGELNYDFGSAFLDTGWTLE